MSVPTHILLFDIDGTLIVTDGAGSRAMEMAFREVFGLPAEIAALAGVDFAGASDRYITQTAAANLGLDFGDAERARFLEAYGAALAGTLAASRGRRLPGFPELLDRLQGEAVVLGLGTGNFRRSAFAKLAHFQLDGYFGEGGFGEDSEERGDLIAAGLARLRPRAPGAEVVVIGDTVHDVAAARAVGARAVAVATGFSSQEALLAAQPDVLLPDCGDVGATLAALIG